MGDASIAAQPGIGFGAAKRSLSRACARACHAVVGAWLAGKTCIELRIRQRGLAREVVEHRGAKCRPMVVANQERQSMDDTSITGNEPFSDFAANASGGDSIDLYRPLRCCKPRGGAAASS